MLVGSQDVADGGGSARALLAGNWPNPVRSQTTIRFALDRPSQARLRIYDAQGRLVYTLLDERLEPGTYSVPWSRRQDAGGRVAPGVYLYRLETDGRSASKSLVVIR